jgi:hypothetical protein
MREKSDQVKIVFNRMRTSQRSRTTAFSAPRRTGEPLFDAIANIVNKAIKPGAEAVELMVEVTQRQQLFLIDSHQSSNQPSPG